MDIRHQPLLEPIQLGDVTLPNRVVMAPMTRARADNAAPSCEASSTS
jgi:2,4-dienoyl-CoA reductase-like NADH-dependent reductase (Old Yellow Enzyme family)